MTPLFACPLPVHLALFVWALAALLVLFACAVRAVLDRQAPCAAASAAGAVAGYLVAQCAMAAQNDPASAFAALPVAFAAAALLACTAGAAGIATRLRTISTGTIGPHSIKAAVDALPVGMLYYGARGQVKLANARMEALSWAMASRPLQDGEEFWNAVSHAQRDGVLAADGRAYSFQKEQVSLQGQLLSEVIIHDVTEEAQVNAALQAENARLAATGKKLRAYSQVAADVVTAREILEAKTAIHDALGRGTIVTRRYLEADGADEGDDGKENVVAQWAGAVAAMRSREGRLAPEADQALSDIADAARALGLQLVVSGEPPRTPRASRALIATAMEAVLNASRHARATTLFLECTREGACARVVMTNDGEPPSVGAREGGGLGLARQRVEAAGGTMAVAWQPTFKLEIVLPDDEGGA